MRRLEKEKIFFLVATPHKHQNFYVISVIFMHSLGTLTVFNSVVVKPEQQHQGHGGEWMQKNEITA